MTENGPAGAPSVGLPSWVEEAAFFSDAEHRVWLRRRLGGKRGPAVFVLHNPSKAGAEMEDQTSRKGISFARSWDCSDLIFVNAATGVATDARDLFALRDPIGAMADEALQVAADFCRQNDGTLIAAWGAPKGNAWIKGVMERRFLKIRRMGLPLHYLRMTPRGWPEHPLYLPGDLMPTPWPIAKDEPARGTSSALGASTNHPDLLSPESQRDGGE